MGRRNFRSLNDKKKHVYSFPAYVFSFFIFASIRARREGILALEDFIVRKKMPHKSI